MRAFDGHKRARLAAAIERLLRDLLALEAGDLDPLYDPMLAPAEQLGVPLHVFIGEAEWLASGPIADVLRSKG